MMLLILEILPSNRPMFSKELSLDNSKETEISFAIFVLTCRQILMRLTLLQDMLFSMPRCGSNLASARRLCPFSGSLNFLLIIGAD